MRKRSVKKKKDKINSLRSGIKGYIIMFDKKDLENKSK